MKVKKINITGVGGIRNLQLDFTPGLNVICGANGIGKTTILNIIADAFSNSGTLLKRNSLVHEGNYIIQFTNLKNIDEIKKFIVKEFDPNKYEYSRYASDESNYVMAFGINRIIKYQTLNAIPKDPERMDYNSANLLADGIKIEDMKGWFVNRYVFTDREGSISKEQEKNFRIAQRAFGLLDPSIEFLTVDSASLDIKLSSNRGDIYFEYLSAGYKTCVYLVLGIIKEIEFRFRNPYIDVGEFDGVILIDEIDLHLHPTWQSRLVETLKILFPKVQFVVTTHSPSVLQTLSPNEIIPLGMDTDGNMYRKELNLGQYGLQGWTIEEILHYVMDMPQTTSKLFETIKNDFDEAMNAEDIAAIKKNYAIFDQMLHPENPLRKLLEIQMIGMGENQ